MNNSTQPEKASLFYNQAVLIPGANAMANAGAKVNAGAKANEGTIDSKMQCYYMPSPHGNRD